ncbi:endonuclease/exonuclease/phosphatase family protein [Nocardioides solisilvae]|uniref:endonuclease/exonuclease/phosphatase family protein n=1 Tax=Nocardioides solisilvae TaxID=1542435 RepID=UPI000D740E1F|nr:endonuclease/exonuclease/phosphatase family protein [Nocardioides solisilvae]
MASSPRADGPVALLLPVLALGTAWWLFVELAAVWGASLITVFGQAAQTPPELMGLFALGCVLAAFPVHLLTRRGRLPVLALVAALVARVGLAPAPGGQVQLWAASVGVACCLAWLAHLVAARPRFVAPGLACGWFLQAGVVAASGTWLPVWQGGPAGAVVLAVLVAAALASAPAGRHSGGERLSRRVAWSVLPLTLVAGVAVVNPGRASVVDPGLGPLLLVVGCGLALLVLGSVAVAGAPDAGRPYRLAGVVAAGAAVLSVAGSLLVTGSRDGVAGALPAWLLPLLLLGPTALGWVLLPSPTSVPVLPDDRGDDRGDRGDRSGAAGPSVLGGGVLWVVLFFAYYAGYDLGYRADWLLVLVTAVLVAPLLVAPLLVAPQRVLPGRGPAGAGAGPRGGVRRALLGTVVVGTALAGAGAVLHRLPDPAPDADGPASGGRLEVLAWNLRMGYGTDGRFDAREVARVLEGADVVLLSEVDRGWLLNGGQDQLAVLARLTGLRAVFNPAADPVWGDAVLTRLPVREVRGVPLEPHGAVTGAGALAVRLSAPGEDAWFVSTHVQPTAARADGTLDQARELAALVADLHADGTPVVLGGDFNFEPGSASFEAVLDVGLRDGLARVRPLPTARTEDPDEQIDHLFVTDRWSVARAGTVASRASDHLPVRAELGLAD